MSRFFRSADSSSSSNSESVNDNDKVDLTAGEDKEKGPSRDLSHFNALKIDTSRNLTPVEQPAAGFNRDFLLHALLEERCINEVLASHPDTRSRSQPRRDDPGVQAEARAKYRRLCTQLASYNLISTGLEHDQHATTRQWYRDGLDLLGKQQSMNTVHHPLRRLLTDTDMDIRHDGLQAVNFGNLHEFKSSNPSAVPLPLQRLLTGVEDAEVRASQLLPSSSTSTSVFGMQNHDNPSRLFEQRYHLDFEELCTLGRGGYGIVYQVRHRVDNQIYAVKKVPLSSSRLQQVQTRGQAGLNEILMETRTLARLNHPNIVKYYNSWIEWVDNGPPSHLRRSNQEHHTLTSDADAEVGAEDSKNVSSRRVVTESDVDGTDVVFEDSASTEISRPWDGLVDSSGILRDSSKGLYKDGIEGSPIASSYGAVDSSRQHIELSESIQSTNGVAHFKEPVLALHMQMSLHPMTLADFLSTTADQGSKMAMLDIIPRFRHCYHVEPSVNIVLAILGGIDYLHSEGIVHRDIKPANIFLRANHNPRSTRGSVDLLLCSDCRAQSRANAININVCIGDFGLVALADPEGEVLSDASAVGTELYRPKTSDPRSPSLDIYALGIVFFELLWTFVTNMERHHTIYQLKKSIYPPHFEAEFGCGRSRKIRECIDAMLCHGGDCDNVSIRELRQMISEVSLPSEQV